MKTLVEIHILQNFAPSNLNRDDTGAPKDAFFGGTRRARISSQCIKRSTREYFKLKNERYFANRTKRIIDDVYGKLIQIDPENKDRYSGETFYKAVETAINCIGSGDKKVKVEKDKKTGQLKTDVLLFLSNSEISAITEIIKESFDDFIKGKVSSEVVSKIRNSISGKEDKSKLTLDIALFGRMLAVMPDKTQYAACQVAHAISTHAVNREFDFFTALDDLKPEESAGSDMMGDVEFTSACYYRYAVVDYEKLHENLGCDNLIATAGLSAFLEAFIIAEPTGKQNSFAAHNTPELIAVNVLHESVPRNLSNAFEVPVKAKNTESLTVQSAIKLSDKAKALNKILATKNSSSKYVCSEDTFADIDTKQLDGLGQKIDSIPQLLEWVISQLDKKGQ